MSLQRNPRARGTQPTALESSPGRRRDSRTRRTTKQGPLPGRRGSLGCARCRCARCRRALVGSVRRHHHGRRSSLLPRAPL